MRGIVKYHYVNENPKGGNLAARWHPVKAIAEAGVKLSTRSHRASRRKRPRGQKTFARWS